MKSGTADSGTDTARLQLHGNRQDAGDQARHGKVILVKHVLQAANQLETGAVRYCGESVRGTY